MFSECSNSDPCLVGTPESIKRSSTSIDNATTCGTVADASQSQGDVGAMLVEFGPIDDSFVVSESGIQLQKGDETARVEQRNGDGSRPILFARTCSEGIKLLVGET